MRFWIGTLIGWAAQSLAAAAAGNGHLVTHPIAAGPTLGGAKPDVTVGPLAHGLPADRGPHAGADGHVVKVANPLGHFSVVPPLLSGCDTAEPKLTAAKHHPRCVLATNVGYQGVKGDDSCMGSIVSDGRVLLKSNTSRRNVNFGIKGDQWVVGYISPEELSAGGFAQLVEGLGWIVHEGSSYVDQGWREAYKGAGDGGAADYVTRRSSRTAVGFDARGQLVIVQFHGRAGAPSEGATMYELADKMVELGAVEAINLETGGSTHMLHQGSQIGSSADRALMGGVPPCETGKGNLSSFDCMRSVSTVLCVHEYEAAAPGGLAAVRHWLPEIVMAVAVLGASCVLVWRLRGASDVVRVKSVVLALFFTSMLQFTIVILDSYRLCSAAQASQSFSGFFIGIFMTGATSAAVFRWWRLRRSPTTWREWKVTSYLPATAFLAMGGLLLSGIESRLSHHIVEPDSQESHVIQLLLCLSQLLSGCFYGLNTQCTLVLMVKLFPVAERPQELASLILSGMLGIGAGPFVAAAMHLRSQPDYSQVQEVGSVGPAKVIIALGCMIAVFFAFPDLSCVDDHSATSLPQPASAALEEARDEASSVDGEDSSYFSDVPAEPASFQHRRRIIIGAFVCTALRGYVLSGMEAGTALLLEGHYGWDKQSIGLSVAATFFASLPVSKLQKRYSKAMSTTQWIFTLVLVALAGSLTLFPGACRPAVALLGSGTNLCGCLLLLADAIVFPCLYMGDALQRGIMNQHLLPEGSIFDANHAGIWQTISWLAQFWGAWVARLAIQVGSQNLYALEQLLMVAIFLCIADRIVAKALRQIEDNCDSCQ